MATRRPDLLISLAELVMFSLLVSGCGMHEVPPAPVIELPPVRTFIEDVLPADSAGELPPPYIPTEMSLRISVPVLVGYTTKRKDQDPTYKEDTVRIDLDFSTMNDSLYFYRIPFTLSKDTVRMEWGSHPLDLFWYCEMILDSVHHRVDSFFVRRSWYHIYFPLSSRTKAEEEDIDVGAHSFAYTYEGDTLVATVAGDAMRGLFDVDYVYKIVEYYSPNRRKELGRIEGAAVRVLPPDEKSEISIRIW